MKQFFNLVVPMAGRGSRFTEKGYEDSKPFIDVDGKPMIQRVIENLNFEFNPEFKTIILCQKSDYERYDFSIFKKIIGHDNIEIIQVDGITEGAACTLLLAKEFIDSDVPMLSFNTDQMIDYDVDGTFNKFKKYDGGIPCFYGNSTDWSYAKTDKQGQVVEVAEKKVISNDATAGYYYWSKGSDFVKYAEQMIAANDRVNNEFYVAPVYNWAIKDGKRICISQVDSIYELGTPYYLEKYLSSKKKIAVCFYGQTRLLETFNLYYNKWNDKSNEFKFDFFISTWNDFDHTKINLDFKKSEFINFEDTKIPLNQGNTRKMAYLLSRVGRLKQSYEIDNNFSYDFVILVRCDSLVEYSGVSKLVKKFIGNKYDRPFVCTLDPIILDESRNYKISGDHAFLLSSEGLDVHSNMYSFFYLHQKVLYTNMNYREGGHWIHPFYFKYNNFITTHSSIPSCIVRPKLDLEIIKENSDSPKLFQLIGLNRKNWKPVEGDVVTNGVSEVNFKDKVI